MKSFKVIKITNFDQNQFMTCYLIFNFKPTYFSYFRKITAISISHNVKKEVGPNGPFPVVKGLSYEFLALTTVKGSRRVSEVLVALIGCVK